MNGDTRGTGARVSDGIGHPPRRLFVLGAGAAAVSLLTGCGLRLDLPQGPPVVPTRRPAPDEAVLLSAVATLREVVGAERALVRAGSGGRVTRRLMGLHATQLAVLTGRLTNAGVPTSVIAAARPTSIGTHTSPSTSGGPGSGATTTSPTAADPAAELAAVLDSVAPADWDALASATPAARELLSAAYGSRLAGAALLGRDIDPPATPSPRRAEIVARTQPLVYAFEVVAAQSRGDMRERALRTLDALRRLELAESGTVSSPPAGWSLPFPVTTPAAAQRLASHVLTAAVDAGVDVAGPSPSAATLEDVARWQARVQAIADGWGMPLSAFPGTGVGATP